MSTTDELIDRIRELESELAVLDHNKLDTPVGMMGLDFDSSDPHGECSASLEIQSRYEYRDHALLTIMGGSGVVLDPDDCIRLAGALMHVALGKAD